MPSWHLLLPDTANSCYQTVKGSRLAILAFTALTLQTAVIRLSRCQDIYCFLTLSIAVTRLSRVQDLPSWHLLVRHCKQLLSNCQGVKTCHSGLLCFLTLSIAVIRQSRCQDLPSWHLLLPDSVSSSYQNAKVSRLAILAITAC